MGLGPEQVTDGSFTLGATHWTVAGAGWDLAEANATFNDSSGDPGVVLQTLASDLVVGGKYILTFDVEEAGGTPLPTEICYVRINPKNEGTRVQVDITSGGTKTEIFTTNDLMDEVELKAESQLGVTQEVAIDNVSIRQIFSGPSLSPDMMNLLSREDF